MAAAVQPEASSADGGAIVANVDNQFLAKRLRYSMPPLLEFGKATVVQARIDVADSSDDAFSGIPGVVVARTIRVTRKMSATLTGPPDQVQIVRVAEFPEWQDLTSASNPTWKWQVRAKAPGPAELDLIVRALVRVPGQPEAMVPIDTYHAKIPVTVGLIDSVKWWIGEVNPIWLWITGVVGAIGGAITWWRKTLGGGAKP